MRGKREHFGMMEASREHMPAKEITSSEEASSQAHDLISETNEEGSLDFSGKLDIQIPKSLHSHLCEQAKEEGVSLNQYIIYKLSK